jgi:hypothetical protein
MTVNRMRPVCARYVQRHRFMFITMLCRWLAAMTGCGLGLKEVGRIVQVNSHQVPMKEDKGLLEETYRIGKKLATESKASTLYPQV